MKRFFLFSFISLVEIVFSQKKNDPLAINVVYDDRIIIHAIINESHPARLIFDTGADGLLLDEDYFKGTGIRIGRSQQSILPGAGTSPKMIRVVLDRIKVGIDTMNYYPPYVPLMQLRAIVGESVDGIVGVSFLRAYLTELDFENKKIFLHKDRNFLSSYDSIKLEVRNNRYYLPVSILADNDLEINGMFQLDLGSAGTVHLTSPTAKQYNLESKIAKKIKFFNENGGAGGRIDGYEFRAKAIKIGSTTLKSPCLDWSTDTAGALARANYSGLIGNEIFERFSVVIDFKNAVLFLKPLSKTNENFKGPVTGFSYVSKIKEEEALIITGLFEGSGADEIGLRSGDKIISVDGKLMTTIDEKKIKETLEHIGSEIELIIKRGSKKMKFVLPRKELL